MAPPPDYTIFYMIDFLVIAGLVLIVYFLVLRKRFVRRKWRKIYRGESDWPREAYGDLTDPPDEVSSHLEFKK